MNILRAEKQDLPAITDILNHGIRTRYSVGYFQDQTPESMKEWFSVHLEERYPVLLAEKDGQIAGWISLSPYRRGRPAFDRTVEISAYIHSDHQRSGVGQFLLEQALLTARHLGFKTIFAVVLHKNLPSIRILEKNNFERWAYLPGVAEIDGVLLDHIFFGKNI